MSIGFLYCDFMLYEYLCFKYLLCHLHTFGHVVFSVLAEKLHWIDTFVSDMCPQDDSIKSVVNAQPTSVPLLMACTANVKTVVANPIVYLTNLTHDILQTINALNSPPHPDVVNNEVKKSLVAFTHFSFICISYVVLCCLMLLVIADLCDADLGCLFVCLYISVSVWWTHLQVSILWPTVFAICFLT